MSNTVKYTPDNTSVLSTGQFTKTVASSATPELLYDGVKQVFTVQAVADVSASLRGTYFDCQDSAGLVRVYFTVATTGTIPPLNNNGRLIVVNVASGASANTVASAINTAMDADAEFVTTVSTDTVTVTQAFKGERGVPLAGTSGFTVAQTTAGVAINKLVPSVSLTGKKARGTDNTGNVFFGQSSSNDAQLKLIEPGKTVCMYAPEGGSIDLHSFYLDVATNADGVIAAWPAVEEETADVNVMTGDVEIGAVELKNASDDTRAEIDAANTARTTATNVLCTQPIDAAGNVLGRTAANTARTTATLVNPSQIVDAAGNVVNVTAANTARTTATLVLPSQPIDAAGNVLGRTAANTARTTATLVDPVQIVDASGNVSRIIANGIDVDNAASTANPVQVGGKAVASASYSPSYTAGDATILPVDKDSGGVLCHTRTLTTSDAVTSTPVASALAATTAYAASLAIKASAGRLFGINGYNSKGSAQFIQIHNATSLPSNTAVPVAVITVPTVANFSIDFGALGIPLSTGIVVANSSTGPTLTVGSADCYFTASYV